MAVAAVAWYGIGSNVGKVITADADAGWDGSLTVDSITKIENTASLGEKVSNTTTELYTVNTTDVTGEPFDFSASGGNDGDHIFGWIYAFAAWDTLTNGGFGLRVADDLATDSLGTWYVGPQAGYLGGWASYVINPSADFDGVVAGTASWTTTGNPAQLSGVDGFGVRWKITQSISGNTDNCFIDAMSVGQGYRLTLGDAGSAEGVFQDFIDLEEGTGATGRYGGLRNVSGILFAKSKLAIGAATGATNTEFIDSNFTVVWEQQTLSDGTSSAVADGFYEFRADQGSGTTDIDISAGSLSAVSPHTVVIDLAGVNSVTMDAVNIDRAGTTTLDVNCTVTDCKFTNSGDIDLGSGATFTGNTITDPTTADAVDASTLTWNVNLDPDGELDGTNITKGANTHHALELGASAPLTVTLTNWTTSGFNATDEQGDSTIFTADRGSDQTWTINVVGGSGNFSYDKGRAGDTVNVNVSYPITVTVLDQGGSPIENVQTSMYVTADNSEVMNADTNASGVATGSFTGSPPTAIYWRARKSSTGSTRYVNNSGVGTITTDGLTFTVVMQVDTISSA